MKILTGIISFLSSIILTIAIIVDLLDQPSRYDDYDNGLLMFFLILVLSLIYYLIITKFWRKGSYTSEHLKLAGLYEIFFDKDSNCLQIRNL